jgi:hypothetical protein
MCILGVLTALILAGLLWFLTSSKIAQEPLWNDSASPQESAQAYEYVPNPDSILIKFTEGINTWYVNETLRFSFRLPDGFSAPDGKVKDANTYVVELSNGKGNTLHIVALKIKDNASETLSEDIIRQQLLEENPHNFKADSLKEGTKGLYFETNSATEGSEGIAFWFTKDGYLYTFATARKDAELLELVMQTFRFGGAVLPPPPL